MRILVVGAGAIGSLFAGKLAGSGNNVTLLARGDRLEAIRKNGLELRELTSSTVEQFPVKVIASLAPDDLLCKCLAPVLEKFVLLVECGFACWSRSIDVNNRMAGWVTFC